jgi:hypothetical protein
VSSAVSAAVKSKLSSNSTQSEQSIYHWHLTPLSQFTPASLNHPDTAVEAGTKQGRPNRQPPGPAHRSDLNDQRGFSGYSGPAARAERFDRDGSRGSMSCSERCESWLPARHGRRSPTLKLNPIGSKETQRMKSRTIAWLALWVVAPGLPVSAQVMPLGRVGQGGGVQQASCQSCAEPWVGHYGGTVWGTSCQECCLRRPLFPPCPNPCRTTLLTDLLCGVKSTVDNTLSHVFGCVFGYPCGCRGACTCGQSNWEMYEGDCMCGGEVVSELPEPVPAAEPLPENPFRDEPAPSTTLQPIPSRSATRSLLPPGRASTQPMTTRPATRRASYEQPTTSAVPRLLPPSAIGPVNARPLSGSVTARRYQPRHSSSLRRSNGATVGLPASAYPNQ